MGACSAMRSPVGHRARHISEGAELSQRGSGGLLQAGGPGGGPGPESKRDSRRHGRRRGGETPVACGAMPPGALSPSRHTASGESRRRRSSRLSASSARWRVRLAHPHPLRNFSPVPSARSSTSSCTTSSPVCTRLGTDA